MGFQSCTEITDWQLTNQISRKPVFVSQVCSNFYIAYRFLHNIGCLFISKQKTEVNDDISAELSTNGFNLFNYSFQII